MAADFNYYDLMNRNFFKSLFVANKALGTIENQNDLFQEILNSRFVQKDVRLFLSPEFKPGVPLDEQKTKYQLQAKIALLMLVIINQRLRKDALDIFLNKEKQKELEILMRDFKRKQNENEFRDLEVELGNRRLKIIIENAMLEALYEHLYVKHSDAIHFLEDIHIQMKGLNTHLDILKNDKDAILAQLQVAAPDISRMLILDPNNLFVLDDQEMVARILQEYLIQKYDIEKTKIDKANLREKLKLVYKNDLSLTTKEGWPKKVYQNAIELLIAKDEEMKAFNERIQAANININQSDTEILKSVAARHGYVISKSTSNSEFIYTTKQLNKIGEPYLNKLINVHINKREKVNAKVELHKIAQERQKEIAQLHNHAHIKMRLPHATSVPESFNVRHTMSKMQLDRLFHNITEGAGPPLKPKPAPATRQYG